MLRKLFCKLGAHKYIYHCEFNPSKFDVKSWNLKNCKDGCWKCKYCGKVYEWKKK